MGLKRGRGTDSVNGKVLYRKTLGTPNLTPQKFRRQLKVVTLREGVQVDYSFPTTLSGDRTYVDLNQNDQQYEGATLTTIDETLLTGNDLVSYKRTGDAQTETINERLVEETDPPPPLSALVTTMDQEAIGDGKSLLRLGVVPNVFPNQRYEANRATLIPAEFSFLVPETSYTFTEAGIAVPIPLPLPLGTTSFSDEQIDVYRHRLKTGTQDFFAPGVLPITITGSRTTKDKQVEQVEKTLQLSSVTPELPTSVLDVTWQNLGNGAAIEEHDFVDTLFTRESFEAEIADVVPHRFKALVPVKTSESVTEGTAGDPTLLNGDLKRTSEQVNVFVVKNTRQYRDITALPVEQFDYKITAKLQVSTVANRLASGLQTLAPDYLWLDGNVQDLGNLTSLRSKETVEAGDFFEERSFERQIPDLIPEKFRPVVPTKRQSHLEPGTAADRSLVTGELSFQSEQVNAFVKRENTMFRDTVSLPQSLTDYELTREKKISTVIATLNTGLQTLTGIDELTDKAQVDNLGNNLSLKTVGTVSDLFEAEQFGKQIPDVIPEKFRVIVPTTRHEFLVAGTAADDRDLDTGELSYTSEQVNAFVLRETSTGRAAASLPAELPGYRMTAQGQVADTLARLATGLQTITPDFHYLEAEVENLGNNLSLSTKSTVDVVFPDDSYTTSILNLIPEKLRAAILTRESSVDSEIPPDISTTPTLLTGELERTEKRLGLFKKRIIIKKLDPLSIPAEVEELGFTEQNGGDTTTTTHRLNTHGTDPVETGQFVLKSVVLDLGNGYDVRTTERADSGLWPELDGQDYDERLDLILPFKTRTRDATHGLLDARTDIKPRDQWKHDERTVDISSVATVLDDYVMSYPSKINIDMPDRLIGVEGIIETAFGDGQNTEEGHLGTIIGSYSISMALRASAQSSASLIPDAAPDIKQFWGSNIDCTHYHFFLPNPVTRADVLTKIGTLVGAINDWPKFNPQTVTLKARGEKASMQATASSQGSAAQSNSGMSSTASHGEGESREHSLNLKTIRISPTIHDTIALSGSVGPVSQPIHVEAHANAAGLGEPGNSVPDDDEVIAVITPSTIPATTGDFAWPTTGKYLKAVDAQPYRYGYVQFHVIIVDAADFPSS